LSKVNAFSQEEKKAALIQVQSKLQNLSQPSNFAMVSQMNSKYADVMRKDLWAVLGSMSEDEQKPTDISATQVFSEMFSGKKAFMQQGPEQVEASGSGLLSGKKADAFDAARQADADEEYKKKMLQGGGVKGAKSYNAQSGAIYGILQQMHEDFETKLSQARTEEANAQAAFDKMKAALNKEIKAQQAAKKSKKSELADTNQKNAQAKKDVEDTTNALTADEQFLVEMEQQCATSKDEHDARVKERGDEIVAVGEAMGILTNDESRDLFTKTFNFVQVQKSSSMTAQENKVRSKVAKMILKSAKKSGNYQLAALAVSAQLDAFVKVKKAMDDMLAELKKQQAAEYEKKEFCNKELDTNEDEITDKTKFAADTTSTIQDLQGQIDTLTKQIEVLELEIANTQKSIKQAGEDRAAENKEFQSTVNDQRMTVTILTKALDRLKQFYEKKASLLQEPGKANAPAPKQASYKSNDTAPGAMGLLEMIIMDAKQMEKEALKDEQDSQTNYAKFVTDSNTAIKNAQTQIESNTVSRAKAEGEHAAQSATLSDTEKILATLKSGNQNLHVQCDFTLKNYDITQEARAQEMESIEQAKAVLSGANFSL
jgi:hypothetical protein